MKRLFFFLVWLAVATAVVFIALVWFAREWNL